MYPWRIWDYNPTWEITMNQPSLLSTESSVSSKMMLPRTSINDRKHSRWSEDRRPAPWSVPSVRGYSNPVGTQRIPTLRPALCDQVYSLNSNQGPRSDWMPGMIPNGSVAPSAAHPDLHWNNTVYPVSPPLSSPISEENSPLESRHTVKFNSIPTLPANVDVNEFYQKLVKSGILRGSPRTLSPPSLRRSETLRAPADFRPLYSGKQCTSCCLRFGPDETVRYKAHLDWHFRQNRWDKTTATVRKRSRGWYLRVDDWTQCESSEDADEKAPITKELNQQQKQPIQQTNRQSTAVNDVNENGPCQVCHGDFEKFYDEVEEKWHARNAVRFEAKNYHPMCLQVRYVSLFM